MYDVDIAHVIAVAFAHVDESETYHWNVVQASLSSSASKNVYVQVKVWFIFVVHWIWGGAEYAWVGGVKSSVHLAIHLDIRSSSMYHCTYCHAEWLASHILNCPEGFTDVVFAALDCNTPSK